MSAPTYDILIITDKGEEISTRWDDSRGWLDSCRAALDCAVRITIVPIYVKDLPAITLQLRPEQRWILFSRLFYGEDNQASIRLHCIGYQETVDGHNNKVLVWVYPNGTTEIGQDPTLWKLFL